MHPFRTTAILTTACVLAIPLFCTGCSENYDRSTPEATVASMTAMVKNGDVDQLPGVIYTEDPNLKSMLAEIGPLLFRIERLAETVNERFPGQVETLKKLAADKAVEQAGKTARARQMDEDYWQSRTQLFLAEPFKNLEEQLARVSVVEISSDMYAIQFDGKPAFGVGLVMRKLEEDGQWYVEWPSNIPGMARFLPQTEAEWRIARSVLKSITNGVTWTEERIGDENLQNLDDVMRQAQEEIFPPVVVGAGLYMRAIEMRPKDTPSSPSTNPSNSGPTAKEDGGG